jgi:hypothetical protein
MHIHMPLHWRHSLGSATCPSLHSEVNIVWTSSSVQFTCISLVGNATLGVATMPTCSILSP